MHDLLLQIPTLMAGLTLMLNRNWNTTVQARTCFKCKHMQALYALI